MKKACVTGITGQTGSYLAELLLEQGYEVHGLIRRTSSFSTGRIDHIYDNPNLTLHYGDLADFGSLENFVQKIKPDFFFNLACQSHVRVSFDLPEYTMDIASTGVIRCLEAIRKNCPTTRFLQASSSELFGSSPPPQNEKTPFHPRSPYACGKIAAYWTTVNYREAYGMHASNSVSFNHESLRRTPNFVTRKIVKGACRIKLGLQKTLTLGNLEAKRDWSHAKDVARAMVLMVNAPEPDDYVIGSGEMRSVKEFLDLVFEKLNLDPAQYVKFDERFLRPAEVDALCADPKKIKEKLGWEPKYSFEKLVEEMIAHDLRDANCEKVLKDLKA